jgi:ABC-2 type transport system ATP-binding protein
MIEIKNLHFQYQKKLPLFDDFSLNMQPGSIVGLLGKNGAGKSTLLNLIAGLMKPQNGEMQVNGYKPFLRNPNFLADLSMVPEEFSLPSVSIDLYVRARSPLYPSFDLEKLDTILKEFELDRSSRLNRLSHGQLKKFLIAFTLASNCKLIVLDEPTNGLDIPSKSQFRKILVGSVTEEQLVIISTHQVKDIDTILDKVLVVDEGKMLFEKTMEEINQCWFFDTIPSLNGLTDVLYHENATMGYKVIQPVTGNRESPVDMELLFNAIIHKSIQ